MGDCESMPRPTMVAAHRPARACCTWVLLALLMTAACYRYQPASLSPAAGTRVRLVLRIPTAVVVAATPQGERREVAGVLEASGTTLAVAADTISLRLGELRTIGGPVTDVENRIALVPVQSIATVNEKQLDTGRTLLTGAGLVLVGAGVAVIVLVSILIKAASG